MRRVSVGKSTPHLSAARVGLLLLAVVGAVAGCGGGSSGGGGGIETKGTNESMGAPPTVVCGTVLSSGAAGPVLEPIWQGGTITEASVGGNVWLQVSRTCAQGSVVSFTPSAGVRIVRSAKAQDGGYAAIVLHPVSDRATVVTALSGGHLVGRRTLRLPP